MNLRRSKSRRAIAGGQADRDRDDHGRRRRRRRKCTRIIDRREDDVGPTPQLAGQSILNLHACRLPIYVQ